MIKLFLPIFLFSILPLSYCVAQKSKKPKTIYNNALRKLKREKAVEKNTPLLAQALQDLISEARRDIDQYEGQNELATKEKALPFYDNIFEKIEKAVPYLNNQFVQEKNALEGGERELLKTLAVGYYEQGNMNFQQAIEDKNKYVAQTAHKAYLRAKHFGHPAQDLSGFIKDSQQFGTVVYSVTTSAPFNIMQHWDIDQQFGNLAGKNTYLQVYYDTNVASDEVDCNIEIRFNPLDIRTDENSNSQNYQESIVVGKETITNANGEQEEVDKLEEINGSVTTNEITKTATWQVRVNITASSNNCKLSDFSVEESLVSTTTECETSGDQRAIPDQFKNPFVEDLMSDDNMAEALIEILYDEVRRKL